MGDLGNLTLTQRALLKRLAKKSALVPYESLTAKQLLMSGLAQRTLKFGELAITDAGRAALHPSETAQRREGNRG